MQKPTLLKMLTFFILTIVLLVLSACAFTKFAPAHDISPQAYDWKKGASKAEIDQMATTLLQQMTLKEKIAQLSGDRFNLLRFVLPSIFEKHMGVAYAGRNERLKIPPFAFTDGPRGITTARATGFPVAIARGASWDKALEKRVGDVMGKEARASGANYYAGLCINLLQHPAWGRAQETYSEDPWLMGEMGVALMQGVQQHNVMACAKHFALNNIENSRFYVNAQLDERTLHEVYLPHFKKCVDNGVASIMSAYNQLLGDYCGHNHYLLTEILRDEWGFEGFVTSDWNYGLRDGEKGANAGMDVEMPEAHYYGKNLIKLVEAGKVSQEQIDKMVLRILKTKLDYITRTDSMQYNKSLIANKQHQQLALEVAEKSMILLKNEGQVLPLSKKNVQKIAVIGALASEENTGDHGSSRVNSPYVVTPLQGLQNYLGKEVEILYNNGKNIQKAKQIAQEADAVLLVVGYRYFDEGEFLFAETNTNSFLTKIGKVVGSVAGWENGGDRLSLSLHPSDIALIQAIAPENEQTIVSMIGGSAIIIEEWKNEVPAILMAWYGGMEGGTAWAKTLFGEVNPSGKLPFTIPTHAEQLPPFDPEAKTVQYDYFHGYTLMDKNEAPPAFPFGFGLSYTSFEYSDLKIVGTASLSQGASSDFKSLKNIVPQTYLGEKDTLVVRVNITNTGNRKGAEVAQLYIGFKNSSLDPHPVKLLRGFEKVDLEAGETKTVTFELQIKDLAFYQPATKTWEVEKMDYEVLVGASSAKKDLLTTSFSIQ